MTSYLITWKPLTETEMGWAEEELAKLAKRVRETGSAQEAWRFACRKQVRVGERVFLLRQGKRGHAILGHGEVTKLPTTKGDGTTVTFRQLVDPGAREVLATHEELHAITQKHWNTQASGVTLGPEVAEHLEELVKRGPVKDTGRPASSVVRVKSNNPDWTKDEHIVALDFYLRHRPTPPNKGTVAIRQLSADIRRIGEKLVPKSERTETFRNENGVYMKLMNFRRLDPEYTSDGRKGLDRGANGEEEVWAEFAGDHQKCRETAQQILMGLTSLEAEGVESIFEETLGIEEAPEGRILTRVHLSRERSRKLAERKKRQVKSKSGILACEVCGFEFGVLYGAHGHDFIECHHTKPVSALRADEVTHLDDLALLCANCHRMIHRTKPWLTLEGLKAKLRRS